MKNFAFVLLRTSTKILQCVYSKEFARFELEALVEESCVNVTANVVKEERSKVVTNYIYWTLNGLYS